VVHRPGGLDQSIRIEMFGDLHEYGGACLSMLIAVLVLPA
jgi:hypothetical protein